MGLTVTINGNVREFAELDPGASLADVVAALKLKVDRVAVERNGEIAPRDTWSTVQVVPGDRLEVVHFVGGGTAAEARGHLISRTYPECT
jgi:sulfur carrier protein